MLWGRVDLETAVVCLVEHKPLDALTLARQINEPTSRRRALTAVADALRGAGNSDEAREVAFEALAENRDIPESGSDRAVIWRADDLSTLMAALSSGTISKESQKAGDEALATAGMIADDRDRSHAFSSVAEGFARAHAYRPARLTAERCTASEDKLSAYAAILREYTIQHHPESAKLFAEASD